MAADEKNIIWIASYPKSGNTWVRFLACNILFGPQSTAQALNQLAPDVHELHAQQLDSVRGGLLKTHFPYSPLLPLARRTAGAIYVVRDPVDVLVSNFHYAQRSHEPAESPASALDRYVDDFAKHGGESRWLRLGFGTWDTHVRSWIKEPHGFPVILVKYEELAADPERVARILARNLRPAATPEEIRAAVLDSSFERMREVEEADIREQRVGLFYKPYLRSSIEAGLRFMRRGAVGEGARRLSPEQRARLRRALEPLASELGY